MLYSGWLFAAISGSLLPCMFFFIGPVFDSFTESTTPEEMAKTIREICIIMGALAVGVFFTSFFQNWLLMKASAGIGAKIKTKYLKAVLN
jgi:ABC-type bacteriocin/lantibiotic exporter with double-glycine peptidase domain